MGASVKLTILNNFKEAEGDIKSFGKVTDETFNRIQRAKAKLAGKNFDVFIEKVDRASAAMRATRGPAAALDTSQKMLRRTIETLIRNGYDPMDEKLTKLRVKYAEVSHQIDKNTAAQKKEAAVIADKAAKVAKYHKVRKALLELERSDISRAKGSKLSAHQAETDKFTQLAKASEKFYSKSTKDMNKAMAAEEKRMAENAARVKAAIEKKKAAMASLGNVVARFVRYGLIAATVAFGAFGVSILSASSKIEDAEAAFRPMLGSLERAEQLVGMINETAATTPFQFEAIAMSAKQLLPAVGGNMKKVIKTFRMLGDTASGNAQRLDSVTRAYTKSLLKGVVDMKSMNMMARAGIPIFTELAKVMETDVKGLMSLSRTGDISSKDLVRAFEEMTEAGGMFHKGMDIASKTLSGRISTLKDNILLLSANLGDVLLPYAKEFVEVALLMVGQLRRFTNVAGEAKFMLEGLAAAAATTIMSMTALYLIIKKTAIIKAATLAWAALSAAMATNPLGALLVALALAVPAMLWVGNNWFYVSNKIMAEAEYMGGVFKLTFAQIENYARNAWNFMEMGFNEMTHSITSEIGQTINKLAGIIQKSPANASTKALAAEMEASTTQWLLGNKRIYLANKARLDQELRDLQDNKKLEGNILDNALNKYELRLLKLKKPTKERGRRDNKPAATGKETLDEILAVLNNKEAIARQRQLVTFDNFLKARMKQENIHGIQRIKFLRAEQQRILELTDLGEKEKANARMAVNQLIIEETKGIAKQELEIFKAKVSDVESLETTASQTRQKFLIDNATKAMDFQKMTAEQRIEFLQSEQARILEIEGLTNAQRLDAKIVFNEAIFSAEEELARKELALHAAKFKMISMFASLGEERSSKMFKISKFASAASAAINSYLAYTEVLKDPSFAGNPGMRHVVAGITLAQGLMQQKKILSTKAPSAETGGRFIVPPARGVDSVGLRVNPGETVDVTPRGESVAGREFTVNVIMDREILYTQVQQGFDSGELTISNDNVRAA